MADTGYQSSVPELIKDDQSVFKKSFRSGPSTILKGMLAFRRAEVKS